MRFLRLSLVAAMEALEAPLDAPHINVGGAGAALLDRSSSVLTASLDTLFGEDGELGMGVGTQGAEGQTSQQPDSIALALLDAVLRLSTSLSSCHNLHAPRHTPALEQERAALLELLGRCLSIPRAAPARKGVRRLLRRLFERREDYDAVRDNALVSAAFVVIQAYVEDGARRPAAVSHNDAVQAALTISKLVKLASTRVRNWQVLRLRALLVHTCEY